MSTLVICAGSVLVALLSYIIRLEKLAAIEEELAARYTITFLTGEGEEVQCEDHYSESDIFVACDDKRYPTTSIKEIKICQENEQQKN